MTLTAVLACDSRWQGRDFAKALAWTPLHTHTWLAQSGHVVTSWVLTCPSPEGHAVCVAEGTKGLLATRLVPAIIRQGPEAGQTFSCPITFLDSPFVLPLGDERTPCRREALPQLFEALGLRYSPRPRIPYLGVLGSLGFFKPNPYYSKETFFLPSKEDLDEADSQLSPSKEDLK